jgi:glycosyltransferase involved in cell wall biosynthesis
MKFSIVIPAYNVEKYINECLASLMNQTYDNFEAIIVNDGSTDNTEKVIEKYLTDKRFKCYKKKNGGLSDARNFGVKKAKGDYLLFLDSDDYYDTNILKNLNDELNKEAVDVLRYQVARVYENSDLVSEVIGTTFDTLNGPIAFERMIRDEYFVTAWSYAYKLSFYLKNKYSFAYGRYHEDFGLIPQIILDASTVKSIPYCGYNYFIRENSITTDSSKNVKRVYDVLAFFDDYVKKYRYDKKLDPTIKGDILSFAANAVIENGKVLKGEELDKFIEEINKHEVIDYLASGGTGQWLKRHIIKHHTKWYMSK